ncbi:hypothetical protein Fcan01_12707 [Folsomia candida]|uniref:Uncharacterized protein n=1 Tax=Folsomia candida TaxID=158441 RepID=A0A226E3X8_FOLCA|nr:hypothetical protein Fcan01_12707 [Folsomia candida]
MGHLLRRNFHSGFTFIILTTTFLDSLSLPKSQDFDKKDSASWSPLRIRISFSELSDPSTLCTSSVLLLLIPHLLNKHRQPCPQSSQLISNLLLLPFLQNPGSGSNPDKEEERGFTMTNSSKPHRTWTWFHPVLAIMMIWHTSEANIGYFWQITDLHLELNYSVSVANRDKSKKKKFNLSLLTVHGSIRTMGSMFIHLTSSLQHM